VLFAVLVSSPLVRLAVLVAVLVVATAAGLLLRRRDGRTREVTSGERLSASELGVPLGTRATLLQISAPVCAPCRAARRVLSAVAAADDGIRHVELDAEQHLDLVRRLQVLRTPTLLVLDPTGRVVARTGGVPDARRVTEAIALAAAS
jgi:thiol-disulfide isomerase/thioredoxin